jgi:hypothetical protein
MSPLIVLQSLSAMAGLISSLKNIFDDSSNKINEKLDEILTQLQESRQELLQSTAKILDAIGAIHDQIDEDVALDNIVRARGALYNDLAIFKDKEAAMGNSRAAADRLFHEQNTAFASAFMYVVNIRLAVLKDFDPNYSHHQTFQEEFPKYINHLNHWIAQINDQIVRSHVVEVILKTRINPKTGEEIELRWVATYSHKGETQVFRGPNRDESDETRRKVEQQANTLRSTRINADRKEFGVLEMENTVAAWR